MEQDREWILETLRPAYGVADVEDAVSKRTRDPSFLAADDDRAVDRALATSCLTYALERHCGRLTIRVRPGQDVRFSVDGPDLRDAPVVVGTGGILAHSTSAHEVVRAALARCDAQALTPKRPRVVIDRSYILAAAGLLATIDPPAALSLLNSQLQDCEAEDGPSSAHPPGG
jgi:uncharacterized protein (TIGR01319 family)